MPDAPSILMVTWNRREYFERTISNVLNDPSDFRLFFWDNGSADGVRDIISALRDDRIVEKQYSASNVGQFGPWHWFVDRCRSTIAGKLDDDIIGEQGWMARLSAIISTSSKIGVLGGWIFLPSDWDEERAKHKIINVDNHAVFQNGWVGGCMFLGRIDVLRRYSVSDRSRLGVPLDQLRMTKDGLINGFPVPLVFGHNLDDPRSPYCRMTRPGGWDRFAAYTARMRNFSGPDEYAKWIADDARKILETPIRDQLRMWSPTLMQRLKNKAVLGLRRLGIYSSVDNKHVLGNNKR